MLRLVMIERRGLPFWIHLLLAFPLLTGCGDDASEGEGESEAEAEAEGEAEAESEGEGSFDCSTCDEEELCQLDAPSGTYGCIAADDCRKDKVCGEQCCPLGTECVAGVCPLPDIYAEGDELNPYVQTVTFEEGEDCELEKDEGPCVNASGARTLLRFTTYTPNVGVGDMYLGAPNDYPELYNFSDCHDHYHFDSYAEYDLLDKDGTTVVAAGGKRAFCLIDLDDFGEDSGDPRFGCSFDGSIEQGISAGWADYYSSVLSCQWIDISDVTPGDYTLRVRLNVDQIIAESDYSNNVTEIPVTIE